MLLVPRLVFLKDMKLAMPHRTGVKIFTVFFELHLGTTTGSTL